MEVDGLRFVADSRAKEYLGSLTIDLMDYWGRESVVAYLPNAAGCY